MSKPAGFPLSVFTCAILVWLPARAADPHASPASASAKPESAPVPAASEKARPALQAKKRFQPPAPLKRLTFSAKEGFALRMVSNQDVTAEIRNGAGRTLARGAYTLQAGDWTLRPRNLAPGLYTVLLRTGPQLRAVHMRIEDSESGHGQPEWVLEKAVDSSAAPGSAAAPSRGASVYPAPD
jgi:hypothetical protein